MPFDRLHCITSTYFAHHVVAFDAFFFVHGASQKVGTTRLPYRLRLINRIAKPQSLSFTARHIMCVQVVIAPSTRLLRLYGDRLSLSSSTTLEKLCMRMCVRMRLYICQLRTGLHRILAELRNDASDYDPVRASLFKPGSNELVGHSISRRRGYHYL